MRQYAFDIRYRRKADTPVGTPDGKLRWFSFEIRCESRDVALMAAGAAFYGVLAPTVQIIAVFDSPR